MKQSSIGKTRCFEVVGRARMNGPAEMVRWIEPVESAAVAAGSTGMDYSDFEVAVRIFVQVVVVVVVVAAVAAYYVEGSVEDYLHQMATLGQSCW